MNELPLPMYAHEVRATLAGRKSVIRRPVLVPWLKGKRCRPEQTVGYDVADGKLLFDNNPWEEVSSPFGKAGDTLWVKETWAKIYDVAPPFSEGDPYHVEYRADSGAKYPGEWPDDMGEDAECPRWKPSIHMPKWASRITLEVLSARVERLQEITEEDAKTEGVEPHAYSWPKGTPVSNARECGGVYLNGFRNEWDAIYAAKGLGCSVNPWVWRGEFRRVQP